MLRVVCCRGDGIGPEVTAVAIDVLRALPIEIEVEEHSFGGRAILEEGTPLPERTLEACQGADAVILGAVGLPELEGAPVRPEQGLIALRRALDVYANLRPATGAGIDLLIVRELVGGLYYGARGRRPDGSAFDTCEYTPPEIERIARRAFELARCAARARHVRRQGERARDVTALARDGGARRGGLSGRRARAHARRHGGNEARPEPEAVRRDPDREHVRRHPLRRRGRHVRRPRPGGLGEPRRRPARDLRAGARLRSRHRGPRHRQSRGDAPFGRAAAPPCGRRAGARRRARARSRPGAGCDADGRPGRAARRRRSSPSRCWTDWSKSPADAVGPGWAGTHGRTIRASEQRRERRPDELDAELAECLRQRRDRVVGRWAATAPGAARGPVPSD